MTNRNMNRNSKKYAPFLLQAVGKDYLWGGTRLEKEFGKKLGKAILAETWECSTHPDGTSRIASGEFAGRMLSDVLKEYPEMLGKHPAKIGKTGELPILVKLIDAGEKASIQVHPDDAYALNHENGANGKAEMWYVVDAKEDARLIYGFYQDMEKETLEKGIADGSIEKYLRKVRAKKDDVFFISPGCVHAIGAGMLIAEIQQNSNVTYRLYDYNRKDCQGNTRELHIQKALDVAELKAGKSPRQPMRIMKYQPGCATELLCRCKYFQVERVLLNTEKAGRKTEMFSDDNSFMVLLCLSGEGRLGENEKLAFSKGDCVFIPASAGKIVLTGNAQILKIRS